MKLLKITLLLIVFVFCSCGSDLSYEEQVENYTFYINKSDSLLKKEKYKASINYSTEAIKITDTVPIALYIRGLASFKLGLLEESEDDFSEVIEIEGETSAAYKDRAKVFLKSDDNDFIDDINIYIKNYPDDNEAATLKREYLEKKEEFEDAIKEYTIAIAKNKTDTLLLTKRADLYFKNGDYEKSIQDYGAVLNLTPNNYQIKKKKEEISSLINKNRNRNIFIVILISFYLIYVGISFFIFKPRVLKKAKTQIGGNVEISKDPLIWFLPIVFSIVFIVLYYNNLIPNF